MADGWTPPLRLHERAGRCRLSLGQVSGEGETLQEASDDLVARLLNLVMCIRASGLRASGDLGPADPRWLGFLWELAELAAQGRDVRGRIFGTTGLADLHA